MSRRKVYRPLRVSARPALSLAASGLRAAFPSAGVRYGLLALLLLLVLLAYAAGPVTEQLAFRRALHLVNTLLVFGLTYQLSRRHFWVGFLTALLWGVHPLHVPLVADGPSPALYGPGFYLLTCLSYLHYRERRTAGRLAALLALFGLTGLTDAALALTLPVVWLCIDFLQGRSVTRYELLTGKLPFLLLAGLISLIGLETRLPVLTVHPTAFAFLPDWRWYGAGDFLTYLGGVFLPYPINRPLPGPALTTYAGAGLLALLLYTGVLLWAYGRQKRLLTFSLGVSLALVCPALLLPAPLFPYYRYLAYVGLLFGLVFMAEQRTRASLTNRLAWRVATVVFSLICLYLTLETGRSREPGFLPEAYVPAER